MRIGLSLVGVGFLALGLLFPGTETGVNPAGTERFQAQPTATREVPPPLPTATPLPTLPATPVPPGASVQEPTPTAVVTVTPAPEPLLPESGGSGLPSGGLLLLGGVGALTIGLLGTGRTGKGRLGR